MYLKSQFRILINNLSQSTKPKNVLNVSQSLESIIWANQSHTYLTYPISLLSSVLDSKQNEMTQT